MQQAMQTLIDDYVSAIRRIYGNHVKKVILYGSYAGGTLRKVQT